MGDPIALGEPGTLPGLTDTAPRADFFRWMVERQRIYWRRLDGMKPPWTADEVMVKYHFTNVYRELDKGTAWFHELRDLRELTTMADVFWASVAYRLINRLDIFVAQDGPPWQQDSDVASWLEAVRQSQARGEAPFSKRHQTRGMASYERTLTELLPRLDEVAGMLQAVTTPAGVVDTIMEQTFGVGTFFAYQIYLDLLEAGLLGHVGGAHRYAAMGLGSTNALKWMFDGQDDVNAITLETRPHPESGPGFRAAAGRLAQVLYLTDHAAEAFDDLKLRFHPWTGRGDDGALRVKDVEHALCEYLRYGLARGGTRGRLTLADYQKAS